jgi:hypothetical protein
MAEWKKKRMKADSHGESEQVGFTGRIPVLTSLKSSYKAMIIKTVRLSQNPHDPYATAASLNAIFAIQGFATDS